MLCGSLDNRAGGEKHQAVKTPSWYVRNLSVAKQPLDVCEVEKHSRSYTSQEHKFSTSVLVIYRYI